MLPSNLPSTFQSYSKKKQTNKYNLLIVFHSLQPGFGKKETEFCLGDSGVADQSQIQYQRKTFIASNSWQWRCKFITSNNQNINIHKYQYALRTGGRKLLLFLFKLYKIMLKFNYYIYFKKKKTGNYSHRQNEYNIRRRPNAYPFE